jgi:hypothetical protein
LVDVATGHELKLFDGHKESCARHWCHGCVAIMVQSWCILLHCISASYQLHIQHFFTLQDYVTCLDLHWPKEVVSAAAETWLARWSWMGMSCRFEVWFIGVPRRKTSLNNVA